MDYQKSKTPFYIARFLIISRLRVRSRSPEVLMVLWHISIIRTLMIHNAIGRCGNIRLGSQKKDSSLAPDNLFNLNV
jgi:hypothetical protein